MGEEETTENKVVLEFFIEQSGVEVSRAFDFIYKQYD